MTQPWIKDHEVRRNLPQGRDLPLRFDAFVAAGPPFCVEWNDLDAYELKPSATLDAVPFMRLSDGAVVALWYHSASPAVVLIGGHGERKVLAEDFDDFLRAWAARQTGWSDFDDREGDFVVRGINGPPRRKRLPELQTAYEKWCQTHTSLLPPLRAPEAESLRQRIFRIGEAMILDGLSKFCRADSVWWSLNLRVDRGEAGFEITYLDYGKWYPLPEKYPLVEELRQLFELVRDKHRSRYDLTIIKAGLVSVDRDRELLLVPPERES